jgi:hypothetical protein
MAATAALDANARKLAGFGNAGRRNDDGEGRHRKVERSILHFVFSMSGSTIAAVDGVAFAPLGLNPH